MFIERIHGIPNSFQVFWPKNNSCGDAGFGGWAAI
jgi:hypothetical protein